MKNSAIGKVCTRAKSQAMLVCQSRSIAFPSWVKAVETSGGLAPSSTSGQELVQVTQGSVPHRKGVEIIRRNGIKLTAESQTQAR